MQFEPDISAQPQTGWGVPSLPRRRTLRRGDFTVATVKPNRTVGSITPLATKEQSLALISVWRYCRRSGERGQCLGTIWDQACVKILSKNSSWYGSKVLSRGGWKNDMEHLSKMLGSAFRPWLQTRKVTRRSERCCFLWWR